MLLTSFVPLSLQCKKVCVAPIGDDKALVRTLLYDLPVVDHQNSISHAHSWEAVRYQDAGLASSGVLEMAKLETGRRFQDEQIDIEA